MFDFLEVGAGPIPSGTAGLVSYPSETYATPILDLTVANLGIELVPAKPGHFAVSSGSEWIIESVNGTQVTQVTCQAGTDLAHVNFFTSFNGRPTNVEVNGVVPPSLGTGAPTAAQTLQRTSNTPVIFDVTVPATGTGGFALRARFCVRVRWIAEGGT